MAPTRAFQPEPTMADLIESGRHSYVAKNYKHASVLFTKAMKSCLCTGGLKRDRCTCKNFEQIAAQGGSIFEEAMYTCHCEVGRTFNKCSRVHHIQALDLRAATYEALHKLDQAKKDAEWILELAPHLPDGYLRLGKIASLQKNDEFAWKIYTAGLEANKETAVGSSPKLQQLYDARGPLHRHFFRRDPLCLPAELVAHILSYLSFSEIYLCSRVCKQWTRKLTSPLHKRLWRHMVFTDETLTQSSQLDQLKKILSWAGDGGARRLEIERGMKITQSSLTLLLKASPSLEHFDLAGLENLSFPSNEKIWNQLRSIAISGVGKNFPQTAVDRPGGFPQTFIQNAASTLEHLEFIGIPTQWYIDVPSIPFLPNLKTCRMGDFKNRMVTLPIFPLSIAFPRLEQLWIGPEIPYIEPGPAEDWQEKKEGVWPHLKVIVFCSMWPVPHANRARRSATALQYLMWFNRGNSLQHIRFDFPTDYWRDVFVARHDLLDGLDVDKYQEFKNLRSFSSYTVSVSHRGARSLLSNAIKTKKLTTFDLVFPPKSIASQDAYASIRHLKGYEWFRGTPTIHTLGCYDFCFPPNPKNDEDMPLPQFLATFPNLRMLRISSLHYEEKREAEFVILVVAIMRVTHLKTIYTSTVQADTFNFDLLRQTARDRGVQLIDGYQQPQEWPIPLEA